MTLPASGQLGLNQVNTETGLPETQQIGIDWIKNTATKDGANNIDTLHGRSYYQRNADGNCDNGNCTSGTSSGNIQCTNCTLSTINCANCDTQNYLQPGTNCACTYNCTQNTDQTYNCNCACACDCFVCACACW